jgi:hypothetical protein
VSVVFNSYDFKNIELISFKLFKVDTEEEVKTRLMDRESDPHGRFTANAFALFPLERLAYNGQYQAEISYKIAKKSMVKKWSFHTVSIIEDFYIVDQPKQRLRLRADRSNVLYFRPLDSHDMLQDIHYPQDISLVFLDNHTIKITFFSDNKSDFILKTGKREIKIEVE